MGAAVADHVKVLAQPALPHHGGCTRWEGSGPGESSRQCGVRILSQCKGHRARVKSPGWCLGRVLCACHSGWGLRRNWPAFLLAQVPVRNSAQVLEKHLRPMLSKQLPAAKGRPRMTHCRLDPTPFPATCLCCRTPHTTCPPGTCTHHPAHSCACGPASCPARVPSPQHKECCSEQRKLASAPALLSYLAGCLLSQNTHFRRTLKADNCEQGEAGLGSGAGMHSRRRDPAGTLRTHCCTRTSPCARTHTLLTQQPSDSWRTVRLTPHLVPAGLPIVLLLWFHRPRQLEQPAQQHNQGHTKVASLGTLGWFYTTDPGSRSGDPTPLPRAQLHNTCQRHAR